MPESRTKNTTRNIVFGVLNKFVAIGMPFVTRTIILYFLGASYLGIGTLFSSVLSFLSLAELGFGAALVYSMYKPIAENDIAKVSALLKYYRKIYRIIGSVMLVVGTLLVPAIPFLIKGNPPEGINVYVLYYIYLINSVISYFFAGYRQSLIVAHQRKDINSKISTLITLFVQLFEILALVITRNFYIYAFVPVLGTIITNITTSYVTKKMYPEIDCRGVLDEQTKSEIKKKISGLLGTKLNSIVIHSSDTIVISAFLGLTLTAKYGNYYYIMNAVCAFIAIIFSSLTASVGDKIARESADNVYTLFRKIQFVNVWIVGCCSAYFVCLYEPFVKIWVGEEMQLGVGFAVLMTLYFLIYEIQKTILTFKDAAGLWHKDKLRPYVSMLINVISNLVLVRIIGIYGIVLSSILAFMISVPWINKVLFNNLFNRSSLKNLLWILSMILLIIVVSGLSYFLCSFCPEGIIGLALRTIVCTFVSNFVLLFVFRKNSDFGFVKKIFVRFIKKNSKKSV